MIKWIDLPLMMRAGSAVALLGRGKKYGDLMVSFTAERAAISVCMNITKRHMCRLHPAEGGNVFLVLLTAKALQIYKKCTKKSYLIYEYVCLE